MQNETQQSKQVIIFANTLTELNKMMERMYDEGWKAVGSHKVTEVHRTNRYSGLQHMDTIIEMEYSQSMAIRMTSDEPTIETGVYWYEDEETGKRVYDEEGMRDEFDNKISELLKQNS